MAGILTAAGGLTSHAAVVARAMGKPCVAGATSLHVDYARRVVAARTELGAIELAEGDVVTIDGARGLVYAAAVPVEPAAASPHVDTMLAWADELRHARVLAAADGERLARVGMRFGADGVLGTGVAADELLGAAGAGPLWLVVESEDEARAALARLRPGQDILIAEPTPGLRDESARRGVTLGVRVPLEGALPEADAYLVEVPDRSALSWVDALALPDGAPVAIAGDAAAEALSARPLRGRPLSLVVPPLDVPVGRLCAARASSAYQRPADPLGSDTGA